MGIRSVVLNGIVLSRTSHRYLKALEHTGCLRILAGIEKVKGHLVLGRHVMTLQHQLILALT